MSIPGSATPLLLAKAVAAGPAAAFQLDRSLRFNDDDNAHMARTPSSAGDVDKWTWSGWVKRAGLGAHMDFFSAVQSGGNATIIQFDNNDKLDFENFVGNSDKGRKITTQVFRDTSAWYHIVAVYDSGNSTADDRIILYVNGSRITSFSSSTNPDSGQNSIVNSTCPHYLGSDKGFNNNYFDGYLANVHLVDGQALAPTDFGSFDANSNWNPKAFSGSYGTNGFKLDFSDFSSNNALGYDQKAAAPSLNPRGGFDVLLYTGDGGSSQTISGLAFQPDFVWFKSRSEAQNHAVFDVVRGVERRLHPNLAQAEDASSTGLKSFNPNGFTIGSNNVNGKNGVNYAAWCWKAGGTAVSNSGGSITSSVSANTNYGFSITSFTGNSTAGATVGHGLGSVPKFIIVKNRDSGSNWWAVYHASQGNTKGAYVNDPQAFSTQSFWNDTTPTSSVFSLGNNANTNANGNAYIAYLWSEISGFSKFGSYTGASNLKITTGFQPRLVLIKCSSEGGFNWVIVDNARGSSSNGVSKKLYPNSNTDEDNDSRGSETKVIFLSDGFQFADTGAETNSSARSYIYAAFADLPGNNFDVNNLVATAGLETAKKGMDVVTWTGNGGTQKIGGPVYSDQISGTQFSSSYSKDRAFDGDLDNRTFAAVGTANLVFTPSPAIAVSSSLRLRIKADSTGNSGALSVNGVDYSSSIQSNSNWLTIPNVTSLTSISFGKSTGNGHEMSSLAAIEVDGVILKNGNGGPGLQFKPDFLWIKRRNSSLDHAMWDSVRGITKELYSNQTYGEGTATNKIESFNSDGFTVKNNSSVNGNNDTYVAWAWKAGGAAASNSDGSITSSVSANSTYGFSVVTYTGTGSNATVGHGLSSAPKWIIVKDRSQATGWSVYHDAIGTSSSNYIELQDTAASSQDNTAFQNTAPTNSVFSIGTKAAVNESGDNFVAYCWSEISGFSKFGSYTGDGGTKTITTGFKPRFILSKSHDSGSNWHLLDSERGSAWLEANGNAAENTNSNIVITYTATGFTVNGSNVNNNNTGYLYMAFADTPDGTIVDSLIDTPTNYTVDSGNNGGNYPTVNPLVSANIGSTAQGNLQVTTQSSNYGPVVSTMATSGSGKWYAEIKWDSGTHSEFGLVPASSSIVGQGHLHDLANSYVLDKYAGQIRYNGGSNGSASVSSGDLVGIAFDESAGKVEFFVNGSSVGTLDSSGATAGVPYVFGASDRDSGSASTYTFNFGASGSFAYLPPANHLSLCTTNLPDPTIADGSTAFGALTYSGNGSARTLTGLNMNPDFIWIKSRSSAQKHVLVDSVRTTSTGEYLASDSTQAEGTGVHISGTTDGITIADPNASTIWYNDSSHTYVAWAWDAGTSTASNTDGSITSSVRANPSAGFSIVTWSGTSANATVGHGLNAAPELILLKRRDSSTTGMYAYHSAVSPAKTLYLYGTTKAETYAAAYNNTAATNSVFSVGSAAATNSGNMLAYCFAPVAGYSAVGSYTGNGSADGPFVFTGMRPAFVLIKNSSAAANWMLYDTARNPSNEAPYVLGPNNSDGGQTYDAYSGSYPIDILSNGFKPRSTLSNINGSGNTLIYACFSEHPFKTARAR